LTLRRSVAGSGHRPTKAVEPAERIPQLTPGQRLCLLLVAQHFSSKEIATQVGISPHTVDQRIRSALRTLNVTNRKEAALLLLSEQANTSRTTRLPWPTGRALKNDMTIGWRLTWIVLIAIGSAFAAGLTMAASESLLLMLNRAE
jgi:DNA-binding CsgD family transcriptional regulator